MLIHTLINLTKFTRYSFIPPMRISEQEYNEIRSSADYVKFIVAADWKTFHASYRMPLLLWSTPLLLASAGYGYILAVYSKSDDFILGPVIMITLYMTLRHGLSAYSLWEFIRKKQKFYKMVKGIADKTGTYLLFLERYKNRNVR
jgi:hypothetical protein